MLLKTSYEFKVAVKVFINGECSLLSEVMTSWKYKYNNTVVLLIYTTPPGVASFITKACVGRVIDKYKVI